MGKDELAVGGKLKFLAAMDGTGEDFSEVPAGSKRGMQSHRQSNSLFGTKGSPRAGNRGLEAKAQRSPQHGSAPDARTEADRRPAGPRPKTFSRIREKPFSAAAPGFSRKERSSAVKGQNTKALSKFAAAKAGQQRGAVDRARMGTLVVGGDPDKIPAIRGEDGRTAGAASEKPHSGTQDIVFGRGNKKAAVLKKANKKSPPQPVGDISAFFSATPAPANTQRRSRPTYNVHAMHSKTRGKSKSPRKRKAGAAGSKTQTAEQFPPAEPQRRMPTPDADAVADIDDAFRENRQPVGAPAPNLEQCTGEEKDQPTGLVVEAAVSAPPLQTTGVA